MKKLTINPNRIAIDEAYMQMAEVWAKRSKANRLQVGALIVKGGRIISDGYNGMPSGAEGDDDVCEEYAMPADYNGLDGIGGPPDPIVRTKHEVLHAEANAILKLAAATNGGGSEGATLYTTYSPCPECAKLIVQAKIARVVYRNHYRLPEGVERLEARGVICEQLWKPEVL
jgi:dCMP deaminase